MKFDSKERSLSGWKVTEDIFICSKVWPTMLGTKETRESFPIVKESSSKITLKMFDISNGKVCSSIKIK